MVAQRSQEWIPLLSPCNMQENAADVRYQKSVDHQTRKFKRFIRNFIFLHLPTTTRIHYRLSYWCRYPVTVLYMENIRIFDCFRYYSKLMNSCMPLACLYEVIATMIYQCETISETIECIKKCTNMKNISKIQLNKKKSIRESVWSKSIKSKPVGFQVLSYYS